LSMTISVGLREQPANTAKKTVHSRHPAQAARRQISPTRARFNMETDRHLAGICEN
jgi:hypothetical protein